MGKYLKMADVFDATCSVPVFTDDEMYCGDSFVAEFNSRGSALLAAHAINTHDELMVMSQDLLAALEGVHRIASGSNMTHNMMVIRNHCADAIAKAKGGAA